MHKGWLNALSDCVHRLYITILPSACGHCWPIYKGQPKNKRLCACPASEPLCADKKLAADALGSDDHAFNPHALLRP